MKKNEDLFKGTLIGTVIDNTRRINVIEKILILIAFFMVVSGGLLIANGAESKHSDSREIIGGGALSIVGIIALLTLMSGDREGNAVREALELAKSLTKLFAQNAVKSITAPQKNLSLD